jgi:TonB family protein
VTPSLHPDTPEPKDRWLWLVFLLFAVLFHFTLLWLPSSFLSHTPAVPRLPRIDVQQFDAQQLERVRQQWRQKSKDLLLDKNPAAPSTEKPPIDARYLSRRNIRVEQETRAKNTAILPKSESQPAPPKLKNLGVPLHPPQNRLNHPTPDSAKKAESGTRSDQSLLDKDLPVGSENLLNAQESVFYSFYARLYEAIGPIWQSLIKEAPLEKRLPPGTYITEADISFDSEGNLQEVRIIKSSGIRSFDLAVEQAWRKIERFPNPPRALLDQSGKVHTGWSFSVNVGSNFGIQYLPPERTF